MRRLFILILAILVISMFSIFIARQKTPAVTPDPEKIPVFASFYPLTFFVGEIGGDKVAVTNITPTGIEPHDFEPKPQQLASLYKAKLLILNGAGLEPWADRIKGDLDRAGVTVVTAASGVELLTKDGMPDPHIWLDPVWAQRSVLNIRDGLIRVDPGNEVYYRSNSDNLIVKLTNLDNLYRLSLFNCLQDTIITTHSVFGYLAKRYKFNEESLAGFSQDEEPSPQIIAFLVDTIREKNIQVILSETLMSPKLSQTIAQETNVRVERFNPLEGLTQEELDKGENYFTIQDVNRKLLMSALQCTSPTINL